MINAPFFAACRAENEDEGSYVTPDRPTTRRCRSKTPESKAVETQKGKGKGKSKQKMSSHADEKTSMTQNGDEMKEVGQLRTLDVFAGCGGTYMDYTTHNVPTSTKYLSIIMTNNLI